MNLRGGRGPVQSGQQSPGRTVGRRAARSLQAAASDTGRGAGITLDGQNRATIDHKAPLYLDNRGKLGVQPGRGLSIDDDGKLSQAKQLDLLPFQFEHGFSPPTYRMPGAVLGFPMSPGDTVWANWVAPNDLDRLAAGTFYFRYFVNISSGSTTSNWTLSYTGLTGSADVSASSSVAITGDPIPATIDVERRASFALPASVWSSGDVNGVAFKLDLDADTTVGQIFLIQCELEYELVQAPEMVF